MSIRLGSVSPSFLKLGPATVTRAYLGSTLVYQLVIPLISASASFTTPVVFTKTARRTTFIAAALNARVVLTEKTSIGYPSTYTATY